MNEKLKTDLSTFNNAWYNPGGSFVKRCLWYMINAFFINSNNPFIWIKVFWLKIFGAKIGKNVVIKPRVNIKYPWNLSIGDYVWIGEGVWIDNLTLVDIKNNACISQGALLLCGNHHYKKTTFDLIVGKITISEGAWVGAKAVVCPGVTIHSHSVLTVGSIATKNLEAYGIYQGNPAIRVKDRSIK